MSDARPGAAWARARGGGCVRGASGGLGGDRSGGRKCARVVQLPRDRRARIGGRAIGGRKPVSRSLNGSQRPKRLGLRLKTRKTHDYTKRTPSPPWLRHACTNARRRAFRYPVAANGVQSGANAATGGAYGGVRRRAAALACVKCHVAPIVTPTLRWLKLSKSATCCAI